MLSLGTFVTCAGFFTCMKRRPVQTPKAVSLPASLGFRGGVSSVHTSRTMMLEELSLVLAKVVPDATATAYLSAIVAENVLGKRTQTTRQRSAKRLTELYALDPACTVFRLLRYFWPADQSGQPMLAFLAASTRDSLLRETTPFVLTVPPHAAVNATQISGYLNQKYPARFRATTLHSTAQNLASSWTQAGFLTGKVKKNRSRPTITPVVVAFACVLGYLSGSRGKLSLDSTWTRLLDRSPAELTDLVIEASQQGWLNYKAAGSVVEITFPSLLTPQEENAAYEQN